MKIIVVDDETEALHAFLNDVISEPDVEYKFYRDDEALICNYVGNNAVDAAFLDINMPGVDGVSLARRLIEISPSIKMVFTTGMSVSEEDLPAEVRANTLGFLYKPYNAAAMRRFLSDIGDKVRVLKVEMFDTFDCFIDGAKVRFSSAKSKELFALLIAYNGKTLTMGDAISQLWPDAPVEKSKILYRDAVWRLRKTLDDIAMPCVEWLRAALSLDKSHIDCDYWNYLQTGAGNYRGEFCKTYEWSICYLPELDAIRKGG